MTTRQQFMEAFRNDDKLWDELTPDDRTEIFVGILLGSSDVTKDSFDKVCGNYGIDWLEIKQIKELR